MNFIDRLRYDTETGCLSWLDGKRSGKNAGARHSSGYLQLRYGKKFYYLHRVVWFIHYGKWPEGEIDHINGNKVDNRLCNLREATRTENKGNVGLPSHNTSGIKGVTLDKANSKWRAKIRHKGKTYHLGRFVDINEASKAYAVAAATYFGEFARVS